MILCSINFMSQILQHIVKKFGKSEYLYYLCAPFLQKNVVV
jgi:hypothetical protein